MDKQRVLARFPAGKTDCYLFQSVQASYKLTQPPLQWVVGLTPASLATGREAKSHFNMVLSSTSTPPYTFMSSQMCHTDFSS